jgi:hypothetical protein
MSLFARLLQAVRSWRRRRVGPKTVRVAGIAMEQLDHRQLLSVNFTGNVPIDFPSTKVPGVVTLLPDFANPLTSEPAFANDPQGVALQNLIKVSGFNIQDIRVTYNAFDDTLNFGINQPASQNHPGEVIAGDSDNNGNWGTVNPAVLAVAPAFQDPPDWGGTKNMGVFLNFNTPGDTAQVAAGFSSDVPADGNAKVYQVYLPQSAANPQAVGLGGTVLPQFEGNVYTLNDPNRPNLEFAISHFSQLYQQITGHALTQNTTIYVGGFGGSSQDFTTSKAFIPSQPVLISAATAPNSCPPASPPILVNPHEHRVIDTMHRDLVRVYVFGTSGFDVTQINPATVDLSGAKPIAHFTRHFAHNPFLAATYVFVASDINLPQGLQTATFTAQTFEGQQVTSSNLVLNIPRANRVPGFLHRLMDKGSVYPGLRRVEATQPAAVTLDNTQQSLPTTINLQMPSKAAAQAVRVNYNDQVTRTGTTTPVPLPRTVIKLNTSATHARGGARTTLPSRLSASLNSYLNHANLSGSGASISRTSMASGV